MIFLSVALGLTDFFNLVSLGTFGLKTQIPSILPICCTQDQIFTESAPPGQISHRVPMSICLCFCLSVCLRHQMQLFSKPLIGPEITSFPRPLIGAPSLPCKQYTLGFFFTNSGVFHVSCLYSNNWLTLGLLMT